MERLARLKLLVTIVDRPKGDTVARICGGLGVHFHLAMLGKGTASSEVLDFLGIGETDKAVILTLAPEPLVKLIRGELVRGLHLHRPGKGILFTLPLSGISQRAATCLSRPVPEGDTKEGANGMEEHHKETEGYRFDLIVASVEQGQTDMVMDAARSAGVTGGTLLHARRAGGSRGGEVLRHHAAKGAGAGGDLGTPGEKDGYHAGDRPEFAAGGGTGRGRVLAASGRYRGAVGDDIGRLTSFCGGT